MAASLWPHISMSILGSLQCLLCPDAHEAHIRPLDGAHRLHSLHFPSLPCLFSRFLQLFDFTKPPLKFMGFCSSLPSLFNKIFISVIFSKSSVYIWFFFPLYIYTIYFIIYILYIISPHIYIFFLFGTTLFSPNREFTWLLYLLFELILYTAHLYSLPCHWCLCLGSFLAG